MKLFNPLLRTASLFLASTATGSTLWATEEEAAVHGAHHGALNWTQLGAQSVTFLIFVGILIYFGRAPISAFFMKRHEEVKRALAEAQRAQKEAEEKSREYEEKMKNIDQEISALRESLDAAMQKERDKIILDAHAMAERVEKDVESAIALEYQRLQNSMRDELVKLTLNLAQELIGQKMNEQEQKLLTARFVKQLTNRLSEERNS